MECDSKQPCNILQTCATDENGSTCVQMPQNCKVANEKGLCAKCYPPLFLVNGYCIDCSSRCSECTSEEICTQCQPQYFLNSQKKCQVCVSNCLNCTSANNCTKCINSYILHENKCYIKRRDECDDNKICKTKEFCKLQEWGNECQNCLENCQNCKDATTCELCVDGYYFENGTCTPCQGSCKTCENKNSCSSCDDGMYLSGSKECIKQVCTISNPCTEGQFCEILDTGNLCTKCSASCKTCSTSTTCNSCQDGLELSNSQLCVNNQCSKNLQCQKNYFCQKLETGNLCQACPGNCETCTEANKCSECAENYFLNVSGICAEMVCSATKTCKESEFCSSNTSGNECKVCPENCKSCDSSGECNTCMETFSVNEGRCLNAAVPIGVGAIVGTIAGMLLVVSVLAGLGVYYSIIKKKKVGAPVLEQDNVKLATVPMYAGIGNGGTLVK
eukprot:EST44242.1 Cysteine-rich membrane protein 2 [Spironucleus salmonicida]